MWDLRQAGSTPVFSMKEMEDYVSTMITNSDGKYLVCASGDGSLTTINIPARKLHVQSEEYEEELTCLGLFKAETKLLAATSKGKMYVFNWGEFGLHSDESPSLTKKAINCMVPITEHIVVTGGEDGILRYEKSISHAGEKLIELSTIIISMIMIIILYYHFHSKGFYVTVMNSNWLINSTRKILFRKHFSSLLS